MTRLSALAALVAGVLAAGALPVPAQAPPPGTVFRVAGPEKQADFRKAFKENVTDRE